MNKNFWDLLSLKVLKFRDWNCFPFLEVKLKPYNLTIERKTLSTITPYDFHAVVIRIIETERQLQICLLCLFH